MKKLLFTMMLMLGMSASAQTETTTPTTFDFSCGLSEELSEKIEMCLTDNANRVLTVTSGWRLSYSTTLSPPWLIWNGGSLHSRYTSFQGALDSGVFDIEIEDNFSCPF